MRRSSLKLAFLAFLGLALPGRAGTLPADALPLPNRVATADVVVAGKVTSIEDKTVMAAPFPGARNKVEYKIAVVTISDALMAPKDAKTIRLGFVPIPPMVLINPPPFQATVGQEGCFFLTKNPDGDFYTASGGLSFLNKNNPNFEKDLALIKRCCKILQEPDTALKAKNAEERFLAAGMLLAKYRTRRTSAAKTEPIDADQSKRILEALAAADWTPTNDFMKLSPVMVLGRLPLTGKDGWMPPREPKAYADYAQKWLKEHAEIYRIEKFVTEKDK
jgi:hypothetical protein